MTAVLLGGIIAIVLPIQKIRTLGLLYGGVIGSYSYSPSQAIDGKSPVGELVAGPDGYFYGTTSAGGANGYGTIFRMDSLGAITLLYAFANVDGAQPWAGLTITGTTGKIVLYGTARRGGANNTGTLFKLVQSGNAWTMPTPYSFGTIANDAAVPEARLIPVGSTDLYGTSAYGGTQGNGTIFDYNIATNSVSILHSFAGTATDGSMPISPLFASTSAGSPIYYGTTAFGGASNNGVVYNWAPGTSTFTLLHSFTGVDGSTPACDLYPGVGGALYGSAYNGGRAGKGTLWKINPDGTGFTTLYNFGTFASDGANPAFGMMAVPSSGGPSNIFGVTQAGGSAGQGVLFTLGNNDSVSIFDTFTGNAGAQPSGTVSGAGGVRGMAFSGGDYGFGTAFALATGSLPLHSFGGTLPTASVSLAQSTAFSQMSVGATVTLTAQAPANGNGIVVSLACDNAAVSVPASVMVPGGSSTVNFTVATANVSASITAHITATCNLVTSAPAALTVIPGGGIGLAFNPGAVTGGLSNPSTGTVILSDPAPTGGAMVTLTPDAGLTIGGNVTIAAGSKSTTFAVTNTTAVGAPTNVHVTANYAGSSVAGTLVVNPPAITSIAFSPSELIGGGQVQGTLTLNGPAPQGGANIGLQSSIGAATPPANVIVPVGMTTVTFQVQTNSVGAQQTATITGTYNAGASYQSTGKGSILLDPVPTVASILFSATPSTGPWLSNITIAGANSVTAKVTLSGPAPGGAIVTLSNDSPTSAIVPSVVYVGASGSATFLIGTNATNAPLTAHIAAMFGSSNMQGTIKTTAGGADVLGPIADASVQAGVNAGTNYGGQPGLLVQNVAAGVNGNANACTYLMLDLTAYESFPSCATLVLSQTQVGTGFPLVALYDVSDTSWTENGITWNNAPGLNRTDPNGMFSAGTFITDSIVPQNPTGTSTSTVCIDLTAYIRQHLGRRVTLQIMDEVSAVSSHIDNPLVSFLSRENSGTARPRLILGRSALFARPAPFWAQDAIPTDGFAGGGAGPSAADSVDLSSGSEQNQPGPDIVVYNPAGPNVSYSRTYRSSLAVSNYASPGLTPGWVDNFDFEISGPQSGPFSLRSPNGAVDTLGVGTVSASGVYGFSVPSGAPYAASGTWSVESRNGWVQLAITFKDRTQLNFTPVGVVGSGVYLLTSVSNALGQGYAINRDPSSHQIYSITNLLAPYNHLLDFGTSGNYLTYLREYAADPATRAQREVDFTYGAGFNGPDLQSVSQIHYTAGPSVSNPRWQYAYTSQNGIGHLLSLVGVPDASLHFIGNTWQPSWNGVLSHCILPIIRGKGYAQEAPRFNSHARSVIKEANEAIWF